MYPSRRGLLAGTAGLLLLTACGDADDTRAGSGDEAGVLAISAIGLIFKIAANLWRLAQPEARPAA